MRLFRVIYKVQQEILISVDNCLREDMKYVEVSKGQPPHLQFKALFAETPLMLQDIINLLTPGNDLIFFNYEATLPSLRRQRFI